MCGIAAKRGRPYWELAPAEVKSLADALDPPLKRVPLPEKELGVVAELGALGFVCFAIFAPRMELDGRVKREALARKSAAGSVVAEAERIAAEHAANPYAGHAPAARFDGGPSEEETAGEIRFPTVAETAPDLIVQADAVAREAGLTPETIVALRRDAGAGGELLDAYPGVPTLDDGTELGRGLAEPAGE